MPLKAYTDFETEAVGDFGFTFLPTAGFPDFYNPTWIIDTSDAHSGTKSIHTPAQPNFGTMRLTIPTTTYDAGTFSFWAKCSAGSEFSLNIDGSWQFQFICPTSWTFYTYTLTAASHDIYFQYGNGGNTARFVWVDELTLPIPGDPVTITWTPDGGGVGGGSALMPVIIGDGGGVGGGEAIRPPDWYGIGGGVVGGVSMKEYRGVDGRSAPITENVRALTLTEVTKTLTMTEV